MRANESPRKGNLFVVSGPSGVGKGTLIGKLMQAVPDAWLSVSCTTRNPRPGEIPDVSYRYITDEQFDALAAHDGFLEWARFTGSAYGTPRQEVEDMLAAGKQVILEIDVQGARQVREKRPDATLLFIAPPSFEELRRRLEGRNTESPAVIEKRLAAAQAEMDAQGEFDEVIVNDNLDEALARLVSLIGNDAEG